MSSNVAIIGGAITGPAAALRLAKLNYQVTVYEARPKDGLISAGILGITHENWDMLESERVGIGQYELANGFYDYQTMTGSISPFRYITWVGLHSALTDAGEAYGVEYRYGHRVAGASVSQRYDATIEATGIAGAAKRMLPHRYSGTMIYRGLSRSYVYKPFIVWRETAGQYLAVGDTPDGAFWSYFVPRPEPSNLGTIKADSVPMEADYLPEEFRRVLYNTGEIFKTPLSDWKVPATMRQRHNYITIGDVNGPVRPVTTSGANLAVMEGMNVDKLMNSHTARATERMMLGRRAYDLELGALLEAPEIGGRVEDVMFVQHHHALFPGDPS